MTTTYMLCDLLDEFRSGLMYETNLIDVVNQILLEFPNYQLYKQTMNAADYFFDMGESRYVYNEIITSAHRHLCNEHKKILMASRIKRMYKRSKSDPSYKMCRMRLKKEFGDLCTGTN